MIQAIERMAVDESYDSVERMVWKFARRFHRTTGIDVERLKSAGDLAAIRAYDTWDPSRGASFPTHVWHCVHNAMCHEAKLARRTRRERSVGDGAMASIPDRRGSMLARLWAEIGDDARAVVLLVVEAPGEIAGALAGRSRYSRRVRARRAILDRNGSEGWTKGRTMSAFWEIEEALEGI